MAKDVAGSSSFQGTLRSAGRKNFQEEDRRVVGGGQGGLREGGGPEDNEKGRTLREKTRSANTKERARKAQNSKVQ